MNHDIKSYRKTAILVGALFLIAMVASLLGGGLIVKGFNPGDGVNIAAQ